MIWIEGSLSRLWTWAAIQPTASPMIIPPAATSKNRAHAWGSENAPVTTAATAKRYATSAVASFTRLSPSRMVTIRRGTFRRSAMAVAAIASGGEMMAPSTNPAASGNSGK